MSFKSSNSSVHSNKSDTSIKDESDLTTAWPPLVSSFKCSSNTSNSQGDEDSKTIVEESKEPAPSVAGWSTSNTVTSFASLLQQLQKDMKTIQQQNEKKSKEQNGEQDGKKSEYYQIVKNSSRTPATCISTTTNTQNSTVAATALSNLTAAIYPLNTHFPPLSAAVSHQEFKKMQPTVKSFNAQLSSEQMTNTVKNDTSLQRSASALSETTGSPTTTPSPSSSSSTTLRGTSSSSSNETNPPLRQTMSWGPSTKQRAPQWQRVVPPPQTSSYSIWSSPFQNLLPVKTHENKQWICNYRDSTLNTRTVYVADQQLNGLLRERKFKSGAKPTFKYSLETNLRSCAQETSVNEDNTVALRSSSEPQTAIWPPLKLTPKAVRTQEIKILTSNYSPWLASVHDCFSSFLRKTQDENKIMNQASFIKVCRYALKTHVEHIYRHSGGYLPNFVPSPIIELPKCLVTVMDNIDVYPMLEAPVVLIPTPEVDQELVNFVDANILYKFYQMLNAIQARSSVIKVDRMDTKDYSYPSPNPSVFWLLNSVQKPTESLEPSPIPYAGDGTSIHKYIRIDQVLFDSIQLEAPVEDITNVDYLLAAITQNRLSQRLPFASSQQHKVIVRNVSALRKRFNLTGSIETVSTVKSVFSN